MVNNNLGSEIFDILSQLNAITDCDIRSYKINVKRSMFLKQFVKIPPTSS